MHLLRIGKLVRCFVAETVDVCLKDGEDLCRCTEMRVSPGMKKCVSLV
jgi:hypothetical protein